MVRRIFLAALCLLSLQISFTYSNPLIRTQYAVVSHDLVRLKRVVVDTIVFRIRGRLKPDRQGEGMLWRAAHSLRKAHNHLFMARRQYQSHEAELCSLTIKMAAAEIDRGREFARLALLHYMERAKPKR